MGFRYCPECKEWLETAEYTVDEQGETVCPKHRATHGFIIDSPISTAEFHRQHQLGYDDKPEMLKAAREQDLVE